MVIKYKQFKNNFEVFNIIKFKLSHIAKNK